MVGELFWLLEQTVDFLWGYVGFPVVIFLRYLPFPSVSFC